MYYNGLVRIHHNLDLDDMILGQGHDSPWGMDNNCMGHFLNKSYMTIGGQAHRNSDSSISPNFIFFWGGDGWTSQHYLKCLYLECLW